MKRILLLKILVITILSLSLTGCASFPGRDDESGDLSASIEEEEMLNDVTLPVTEKLRFEDLPVPMGFKLNHKGSFVFQNEQTRVALLKYKGRATQEDLIRFYREQMMVYSWKLLNVVEYGKSVLNFERGPQSCIITIEPEGSQKLISIAVSPKPEQETKK